MIRLWRSRDSIFPVTVPIGVPLPWFPHFGLSMPVGYVECNGQTLSDAASPLNGMVIPDMNGEKATPIGDSGTSGVFVGSNSVSLTAGNLPTDTFTTTSDGAHVHTYNAASNQATTGLLAGIIPVSPGVTIGSANTGSAGAHTHTLQLNASQTPMDNRQRSIKVRWIMRIK